MPKISLAAYSISVRQLRNQQQILPLDNFDGSNNLADCIFQYCSVMTTERHTNANIKTVLYVNEIERNEDARIIYGIAHRGEYGFESVLYDTDRKEDSHNRTTTEAEMIPYYFLFWIAPGASRGIAILQRFGNLGIRTDFHDSIMLQFREQFLDYRIDINPLMPIDVIRQYVNEGDLKALEFKHFSAPSDISDLIGQDNVRDAGHFKVEVRAKRNSVLQKPEWMLNLLEAREYTAIVELVNHSVEDVRAEIQFAGTTKKIDFTNFSGIRAYFDITDEIEVESNGHPNFSSMHNRALGLLEELKREVSRNHADQT